MPGAHPLGLGYLGGFLVIGSFYQFIRYLRADLLKEIGIAQSLGLIKRQAAFVFIRIGNAVFYSQLGQKVAFNQKLDHEGVAQLGRQIRQLPDNVIGGHLNF